MTAVVIRGDARHLPLPDASVDLIVTSPPYFSLRSYTDGGEHYDGQLGSEATPQEWLDALLTCTRDWMRVLKPSGSMFINLGDKYAGAPSGPRTPYAPRPSRMGRAWTQTFQERHRLDHDVPAKSLMGLPWRYAIACTDQLGLTLRRDIIWNKPNGLPESVTDRCRSSHEYLFHLVKQPRYYAAVDEIREPHTGTAHPQKREPVGSASGNGVRHRTFAGQTEVFNPLGKLPGSVWTIPSQPLTVPDWLGVDHFAAYPMELPRRCILGWSPPGICTTCNEGRRPVAERTGSTGSGSRSLDGYEFQYHKDKLGGLNKRLTYETGIQRTITGYACACPDTTPPTRPSVVLDPFGGTGTTALVAAAYGRTGVSVDLSADYCRLATWRTRDPAERARALCVAKPPPIPDGQESLFDDMEAI